ncbi:MAG: GAP family protein [bacterium]
MLGLILSVLPLAAAAAISPTVLVVGLGLAANPNQPGRRLAAFALGGIVVLAGVSVLALATARGTGGPDSSPEEVGAVQLALAAVLVALGIHTLARPPRPPRQHADHDPDPHLRRAFVLGMAIMATNVTTLALFFPAVHLIGVSDVALTGKAMTFVVLLAIVLLPAEIPLVASHYQRLRAYLGRAGASLAAHQRTLLPVIEFGFGAYLAVLGLSKLA